MMIIIYIKQGGFILNQVLHEENINNSLWWIKKKK